MMHRLAWPLSVLLIGLVFGARIGGARHDALPPLLLQDRGGDVFAFHRGITHRIYEHDPRVFPSPDGQWEVIFPSYEPIYVRRRDTPLPTYNPRFAMANPPVVWSPDSTQALAFQVSSGPGIALMKVSTVDLSVTHFADVNGQARVQWSPDGAWFTVFEPPPQGDADGGFVLSYAEATAEERQPLEERVRYANDIVWNPTRPVFAYITKSTGTAALVHAATGDIATLPAGRIDQMTWSPDGEKLLVTCNEGRETDSLPAIWDGETVQPLPETARGFVYNISDLDPNSKPLWSPDGRWLAMTVSDQDDVHTIQIYDTTGGVPQLAWTSLEGVPRGLFFSADSGYLVAALMAPATGTYHPVDILLLDLKTGDTQTINSFPHLLVGLGLP